MADCLFCKIVRREIPATLVYEDDRVARVQRHQPAGADARARGAQTAHRDAQRARHRGRSAVGELVRRAAAIAGERGLSAGGYRTVFNTNRDAGQTVFHIHLHLLGGRAMAWPPG